MIHIVRAVVDIRVHWSRPAKHLCEGVVSLMRLPAAVLAAVALALMLRAVVGHCDGAVCLLLLVVLVSEDGVVTAACCLLPGTGPLPNICLFSVWQ